MTALIDQMTLDASARLNLWVARSAGQHRRAIHNDFNRALVNHFYEAGNVPAAAIEFSGSEPDEKPLSINETLWVFVGMALGLVMFGITVGWIYAKWKLGFN